MRLGPHASAPSFFPGSNRLITNMLYELCHRLVPHLTRYIFYINAMTQTGWHPRWCLFRQNTKDRALLVPLRSADCFLNTSAFYSWTCECSWPFIINFTLYGFTLCGASLCLLYTPFYLETQLAFWSIIADSIKSSQYWVATSTEGLPLTVTKKEWHGSFPYWCSYTSCPVDSGKPLPNRWWISFHSCDHYCWHWDSISLSLDHF